MNVAVFWQFSGRCNIINDPYSKLCAPDVVKNLKTDLLSKINETRQVSCHETCRCKCRLDAGVCNNKQHKYNDKCRCACKKLIYKGRWDNGFIWNPSICE